ncbi:MAG: hypothetical protein IAI49_10590 [Candidatus Eremiobacteraeota bacterium]|nr:hypothetical protein [Candidatus Eremiobacteraeota bacterium]
MTSSIEWWSIGIGIMALLFGVAFLVLCLAAARLLSRIGRTLDEVDRQIPALSTPIATTLTHVGGIADTADATIARFGLAIGQLEYVASAATRTTNTIGQTLANLAANFKGSKNDTVSGGESI